MPGFFGFVDKNSEQDTGLFANMRTVLTHEPDMHIFNLSIHRGKIGMLSLNIKGYENNIYKHPGTLKTVLIDGEIYNKTELLSLLNAPADLDNRDNLAEIIYNLYTKQGENFIFHLNGLFNILIHDPLKNSLLIFNDRFGFKPLFYADTGHRFMFGPEVKAILSDPDLDKELDTSSISEFFHLDSTLQEKTFFKAIQRLKPASKLEFCNNALRIERYWSWNEYLSLPKIPIDTIYDHANQVFKNTITRYFHGSEVVLSLTGGFDTRMILSAVRTEHLPESTITYGHNRHINDNIIAARISRFMNIPHHFVSYNDLDHKVDIDLVRNAVNRTDGMMNVMATSILLRRPWFKNKLCVTGKYGTQIFHPVDPIHKIFSRMITVPVLARELQTFPQSDFEINDQIALTIQEECRHLWYGHYAIENSFSIIRTPYLDNDIVKLAIQCPKEFKLLNLQINFILQHNHHLANFPMDSGFIINKRNFRLYMEGMMLKFRHMVGRAGNSRRTPYIIARNLRHVPLFNNYTFNHKQFLDNILKNGGYDILYDSKTATRFHLNPQLMQKFIDDYRTLKTNNRYLMSRLLVFELFLRQFCTS